jgi:radical SAM family protein
MTQGGPFPVETPWSHHAGKRQAMAAISATLARPQARLQGNCKVPDVGCRRVGGPNGEELSRWRLVRCDANSNGACAAEWKHACNNPIQSFFAQLKEVYPMPVVSLIFPPLVWSAFDSAYPSTAVLSAFLRQHGIETTQDDLNDEFARFLVDGPLLSRLGAGKVAHLNSDSVTAAAARWAQRNRQQLLDGQGRLLPRHEDSTNYRHVMEILSRPFFTDGSVGAQWRIDQVRHPGDTYVEFYEWCAIAERLPTDVSLIGISVPMGPQLLPALLLADHLKKARPGVPIVLGGPTLSLMDAADSEKLLAFHPAVNCIVRYDGEFPLLELARQALAGTWNPRAVAGVSYLADGQARHNAPSRGPNVNKLPPPDYPAHMLSRKADPTLAVIQARGCYWGKCDYCDFVELFEGSPAFRGRHPENFVDEIELLIDHTGIRRFRFITESIPPAFARRACELFLDRHVDLSWHSFAMVDRRFDRDLLALMVEAGCDHLVVGLETMNTRVLKLVHKSADREENLRFLRDARDVGMRLTVNLIADLPSTTYEEAEASLAEIRTMSDCFENLSVFSFEPTRSSRVGRSPEKFGLIEAPASGSVGTAQYGLNHYDSVDPAMTASQRAEIHRRYRAFGAEIERRNAARQSAAVRLDTSRPVRIPVEELDIVRAKDKLICTQLRTRQKVTVSGRAAQLLTPHISGNAFMLAAQVDDGGPSDIARNLDKLRILVPAASDSQE